MAKKPEYKVTVVGPGHNFERSIDEATAGRILSLVMMGTAAAPAGGGGATLAASANPDAAPAATQSAGTNVSLAAYIKAKKGEQSQVVRFLATASWLSRRSSEPLTASAVSKALSDNHQKRLANSADCLNKNVGKGLCEKRKDGSFFITPEGLQALEGTTAG
jgi:hypothetical protein